MKVGVYLESNLGAPFAFRQSWLWVDRAHP